MSIKAYEGISDSVLDQKHTTANGKTYTIRCDEKVTVDMNFIGKNRSNSNSQGWERDSNKFFEQLSQKHPEMFSSKNLARIQNKQAPIVDQTMIDHVPQYATFRGEPLVHHHLGGDGKAAAVPTSMHAGYGEIHNYEKNAGITQNCKDFSEKCDNYIKNHPDELGKNATEMSRTLEAQQGKDAYAKNAEPSKGNTVSAGQQSTSTPDEKPGSSTQSLQNAESSTQHESNGQSDTSRSRAVMNTMNSQSGQTDKGGQTRSEVVNHVMAGEGHGSGQSHAGGQSFGGQSSGGQSSGGQSSGGQSSGGQSSGGQSSGGQSSDGQSSGGQSK